RTTTVVIGAGHGGLAMSRCLSDRSIDHVVLERGEVANTWKTERWDSLRLLTPNWQSRLPGFGYDGDDPDGFRTMPETIRFIERYAASFSAPVRSHTNVTSVRSEDGGYEVRTDRGEWRARAVVLASGACSVPAVPALAALLSPDIRSLSSREYRRPSQIEPGGVLVVGASASGTQIGEELQQSGRSVTLAVGEHIRTPRTYRGRDIKWWMDAAGVLNDRYDEIDDIVRARNVPSLQLAGSDDRRTIDLNRLSGMGVRLVGRLVGLANGKLQFSGSLRNMCEMSDLKMNRLLERIDMWAATNGLDREADPSHRFEPTRVGDAPELELDLRKSGIKTVIWATGFRPDYSWLEVPVLDRKGRIRHDGGVVEAPGMYLLGLPFLRRRKSSLIDGAADDARDLVGHLTQYLDGHVAMSTP
ncbi:MAG TPA: NAD(P)-binding domain-containing protein, partial [Candidatus Eisenbacteria bacterium]|nr:NAD(P)-binding domain-containing protein [Candidatus Eisenbacteria bacterium]